VACSQSSSGTGSRRKEKRKKRVQELSVVLTGARDTESEVDETHQELKQQISVVDYHSQY
jgi:hypothetical protein